MVEKFKGNNPKNARIKVDYSGVKPKVTFSYPSKNGTSGSMFPFICFGWAIIWLIFFYGYTLNPNNYGGGENVDLTNYSQCIVHFEQTRKSINETCTEFSKPIIEQIKDGLFKDMSLEGLIFLLSLVIPPLLIYFPFKKFWTNVYPKFNGFMAHKKLAKFNPKDVKNNKEYGYYCEIPLFDNIVLNYEATKDFSKYLKFFEIEEHRFKYYCSKEKSKKKLTTKQKKNRKEKMINENLWYARFYFSQRPQTGSLEVIFK